MTDSTTTTTTTTKYMLPTTEYCVEEDSVEGFNSAIVLETISVTVG